MLHVDVSRDVIADDQQIKRSREIAALSTARHFWRRMA